MILIEILIVNIAAPHGPCLHAGPHARPLLLLVLLLLAIIRLTLSIMNRRPRYASQTSPKPALLCQQVTGGAAKSLIRT